MGDYVNSKQVRFDKSFVSCGVMEAHHLPEESPSATLFAICNALYHKANGRPAAFVIFSDVVDSGDQRGQKLADYIKAKSDDIFESAKEVNPKTGHVIRLWVWRVDHANFRRWYTEEYVNRITES